MNNNSRTKTFNGHIWWHDGCIQHRITARSNHENPATTLLKDLHYPRKGDALRQEGGGYQSATMSFPAQRKIINVSEKASRNSLGRSRTSAILELYMILLFSKGQWPAICVEDGSYCSEEGRGPRGARAGLLEAQKRRKAMKAAWRSTIPRL